MIIMYLFSSSTLRQRLLLVGFLSFFDASNAFPITLVKKIKERHPDFIPGAIVDVGANQGAWTQSFRKEYPDAKVLMIEASPDQIENLNKTASEMRTGVEYHVAVLSKTPGEMVRFYFSSKFHTGNSMFQENTDWFSNVEPVDMVTSTLDIEIANSFLKKEIIDFIKVDVQGAELLVFEGGRKALEQATFVQFEGSTIEYNAGGSCSYDVDAFLRSMGFYMYDVADFAYAKNLFKENDGDASEGVEDDDILDMIV